jgi:hypothetical protein
MLALGFLLAATAVALDILIFLVGLRDPLQYELASYVLLGLFAGWPWWRALSPRPITALRVIAVSAGWIGLCLTMTGIVDRDPARQGYALHAYGLVALALYAEILGAIFERRDHGSDFVPRALARPRALRSIQLAHLAPISRSRALARARRAAAPISLPLP